MSVSPDVFQHARVLGARLLMSYPASSVPKAGARACAPRTTRWFS